MLQDFIDSERDSILKKYVDWLKIPSVSAQPDHHNDIDRSAEYLSKWMQEAGLENVKIISCEGRPAVYGDWLHAGSDKPTALIYGHHDVQPDDPLDEWKSPPFEPVIIENICYARGSVDDKGQISFQVEAVRGMLSTHGSLPINVKFLVEGEEEVGSPTLEKLLAQELERFKCDVLIISDTGMFAEDVPTITIGMRGIVGYDVRVRTSEIDLHSGTFGGAVPNSAHVLASFVASLHNKDGQVNIPHFYDDVIDSNAERESLAKLPYDENEFMSIAKVKALVGEKGRSVLEQTTTRPTCEVTGITVGYGGDGIKTIVPAQGGCKIAFRLVANQSPQKIAKLFEAWAYEQMPDGVELQLTPEGAVAPAYTSPDHPYNLALARTITKVWGKEPLFSRVGGSGPEEALSRILNAPLIFLGVALPDDQFHAPNEHMKLTQFFKGLLAAAELWNELAV